MQQKLSISVLTAVVTALAASTAFAEARLAGIFQSNMVLQRQMPVPIWGWANPGEQVTVTFAGQEMSTVAGDTGKWMVTLAPLKSDAKEDWPRG